MTNHLKPAMKSKKLKLIAAACILLCSACKKQGLPMCCGANPPEVSVFHNWNIVSDSTYTGVGVTNHPVDYSGQPGDYFNVTTNGVIYTSEGGVLDTLTYKLLTDSTIVVSSFGITLNGVPATSNFSFTATAMHISSPTIATPGGVFGRKISLSR
jgi:hypothetical protein